MPKSNADTFNLKEHNPPKLERTDPGTNPDESESDQSEGSDTDLSLLTFKNILRK